ncbi:MAG: response regulator [Chlamydiota bacterium]|nr:response regulator [Chlamydiota bacterium]
MSEKQEKNISVRELFQRELEVSLEECRSYIKEIKMEGVNPALLDELLRITHSIKGSAKLVKINPILELVTTLEQWFHAVKQKKIVINNDYIQSLFLCIDTLNEFTSTPPEQLDTVLEENRPFFESFMTTFTVNKQDKQASNNTSSALKSTVNQNYDKIEKFLNELKHEINVLIPGVLSLRSNVDDRDTLEEMVYISKKIKELGNSVNIRIVSQLGDALASCFQAAVNQQLTWTQGHMDLLRESVNFLQRLSECNAYNFDSWLRKHEKGIDATACVIEAISREASTIPPKKDRNQVTVSKNVESKHSGLQLPKKEKYSSRSYLLDASMLDLFYGELEQRVMELNEGLLSLESHAGDEKILEALMRAAHSLKGAARIVELPQISRLAHSLEDYFTSIQVNHTDVNEEHVDELLKGVDLFERLSQVSYQMIESWIKNHQSEIDQVISNVSKIASDPNAVIDRSNEQIKKNKISKDERVKAQSDHRKEIERVTPKEVLNEGVSSRSDSFLRVSAQNLNRLMGLAGESLVESHWLTPFSESLLSVKLGHHRLAVTLNSLHEKLQQSSTDKYIDSQIYSLKQELLECQFKLNEKLSDLDLYIRRHQSLADRMYSEVIKSRMRPLSDGIEGFPRLIRGLAKQLRKKIRFEVIGKNTPIDREILEKLEAPLNHLLRNAVDHGIELPAERIAAGKDEVGVIKMEACHKAGMLSITISDDGRGVNLKELQKKIIEKGFVSTSMAEKLTEGELLEFMFLPGFSTSQNVTEISGRGIGLNVVQNMIQEVGGDLKASLENGMVFHLQLPLTLSVIRALLVEISGEPYALPLARLKHVLTISKNEIKTLENRCYICQGDKNIGLVQAHQFLELDPPLVSKDNFSVVVISDGVNDYGIIVDHFIGEKELVVQELDPNLGKVPDISGGAFMEDGSPVLIIDVEDMMRSIDKLLSKGIGGQIKLFSEMPGKREPKKILVIDDSVTVRELESRLLENIGYRVDTAVNGVDGWNAARASSYDLIITDIDMPRMNGIELVSNIRSDPKTKAVPVMIVSYKERIADKEHAIEVGANYYLSKSSFHDESLVNAVNELIGEP